MELLVQSPPPSVLISTDAGWSYLYPGDPGYDEALAATAALSDAPSLTVASIELT